MFREGGPLNIKRTGTDQYTAKVSLPTDPDGRLARECLDEQCSPGYFKVTPGTGITGGQEVAYCPYCRCEGEPHRFATSEQLRYAKELLVGEAEQGVGRMLKNALGLDASGRRKIGGGFASIEMSYTESPPRPVRRPLAEEVRRDVVCPHCGLDQSVYGLATWCADCGRDIFVSHVAAEFRVLGLMLSDVDRRRTDFGRRVAAKDIENALEDVVSIFEAVLRTEARRVWAAEPASPADLDAFFRKIGNAFQNVRRAEAIFADRLGMALLPSLSEVEGESLAATFEKRHPITHNLGIVDKKYIERARTAQREGRDISVTEEEIRQSIDLSLKVFESLHEKVVAREGAT